MGVSVPYIQARQSGRVEYRRVFPKELRPYIGATELVRTLKAKSVTEPAAVELLRAANEEYDRRVALARKAASGRFDELDGPKAAWLVESYYAAQLAKDDAGAARHFRSTSAFRSCRTSCDYQDIGYLYRICLLALEPRNSHMPRAQKCTGV
jgi:hypothetical protein